MVLGPLASAAFALRRAGFGPLLFAALGLATMATIAGLGMRSLPDEAPTPVASTGARAFDATGAERLLARAPIALRVDHVAALPQVDTPQPPPRAAATPAVRASRAPPSHATFAAAHAAKKRTFSTALARR